MPDSLKQKAAKGVLWSTIERFSVQGVQFLIMIVMARLLTPHDYGNHRYAGHFHCCGAVVD